MKVLVSFLVGVIVGVAGYWYFAQPNSKRTVTEAQASLRSNATTIGQSLQDTFATDQIKNELARTGRVIREKAGLASISTVQG